jgi:hypothetical protein
LPFDEEFAIFKIKESIFQGRNMELRTALTQTANSPLGIWKLNRTHKNTILRSNNMIFMPNAVGETTLEIIIQHLINEELIREAMAL